VFEAGARDAGGTTPVLEPPVLDDDGGFADALPVDEAASECAGEWILPDSMGFVAASSNPSGITGRWSMHTDCDDLVALDAGTPIPGTNCSLVTAPPEGMAFAPDPTTSAICTAGSTAQVFSADEWGTRWGAYAALDLKEVGDAATNFNAQAAGLRGFCLYISGTKVPVFRIRFASDQGFAEQNPYGVTVQHEGWHRVLFSQVAQVTPTNVPFDPIRLVSIEVEIPASQVEPIPWDFCVEGLVALQ
jgi:hypothetical protein